MFVGVVSLGDHFACLCLICKKSFNHFIVRSLQKEQNTGTPPLTRFFGTQKNHVKGKPHYRRNILVLKPQNGEFDGSKSTFSQVFTSKYKTAITVIAFIFFIK